MRRLLILILLTMATTLVGVRGQTAAVGLYAEGNAFYRGGEFAAARQRYLAAVKTGVQDVNLFYNLGNACFKSEHLGEAVLWYERSLRLDPRDEDVVRTTRQAE